VRVYSVCLQSVLLGCGQARNFANIRVSLGISIMTLAEQISQIQQYDDWIILSGYMGSISHGTHNPDPGSIDDIDMMCVLIPPIEYYLGLKSFGSRGTKEIKEGRYDLVLYEFRKFVSLLVKGNPNVIGLLYLKPEYLHKVTDMGRILIENRDQFLTQALVHSMLGYANAQLRKLDSSLKLNPSYRGYMSEKRKKLVEKHGYDTKYAGHLIRLLRMCLEFIETKELNVYRINDGRELYEIKNGKWPFRKVESEANRLSELCVTKLNMISDLPESVDQDEVDSICVTILKKKFGY